MLHDFTKTDYGGSFMEFNNGMFAFHGALVHSPIGWTRYVPGEEHWCTTDITCAQAHSLVPGGRESIQQAKEFYAERIKLSSAITSDYLPPAPEGLKYFPFQRAGIEYLLSCKRAILADEMGLGKTVQAIGLMNATQVRPVLIMCPASLKGVWDREVRKWLTYYATVGKVEGRAKENWRTYDITIINYDVAEAHKEQMYAKPWGLLVLDECHYLKNPSAGRTACVLGTKRGYQPIVADRVVAITGTPIPSRPIELQAMLRYIDPYGWSSRKRFGDRYCMGRIDPRTGERMGASNLSELNERVRGTVMVRRLKKDVLTELPDKIRAVVPIDIGRADLSEIRAQDKRVRALTGIRASGDFTQQEFARAVHALSVSKGDTGEMGELAKLRRLLGEAKVATACVHIQETIDTQGKVVVFAWHQAVISGIVEHFGARAVSITGATPAKARLALVDRFQNDDGVKVFVGNIRAAGVGITLTAASEVIFVEGDWVPGNLDQAEDRCHRVGQKDTVFVRHLVVEDTLDAIMARAVVRKQSNIIKALDVLPEEEVLLCK